MDLKEIGWDGMDWIDLVQVRDQWKAPVVVVVVFNVGPKRITAMSNRKGDRLRYTEHTDF
jgi:hypothetical protein